ncbi:MAG: hypothetical protein HOJ34_06325 [Kordiimonadaceae bacterium]|nr:hypothetical protein [Kordiimonadaceae bacterium]MBT6329381.1 hypothetical protein [Kordiimonadaceae bacterium]
MLVKKENRTSGVTGILGISVKKMSKNRWTSMAGILIVLLVALSSSVYYGAHLYRTYQVFTLYDIAKGIINLNFEIPKNYFKGLMAEPRVIVIDFKNNDYQKLAYLRRTALESSEMVIGQEIKDEIVPGRIRFFGDEESIKAEFSLSGQNFDHIGDPNRWSLRVKTKGDNVLAGMKKFTLVVPKTRAPGVFSEWLNHKFEQYLGMISLRYEFVRVVVNGKDIGIFAFEEHFDKRLLEDNNHREGLIVQARGDGGLKVFGPTKVAEDPALQAQWVHLQSLWQSFRVGDIPTSSLFSIDELAKYYAIADLVNGQHTHYDGNEFFYFNPLTRLLQPIGREWSSPYKKPFEYGLFIETLDPAVTIDAAMPSAVKSFQRQVFDDDKFVAAYFQELQRISSKSFIDDFLESAAEEISEVRGILYSQYPYLDMSEQYLFSQMNYINNFLAADHSDLVLSYFESDAQGTNSLVIKNNAPFPISLTSLNVGATLLGLDSVVPANSTTKLTINDLPQNTSGQEMTLLFGMPGIQKSHMTTVFPWAEGNAAQLNSYPVREGASDYVFKQDNQYILSSDGNPVNISENLVVPKGYSLIIRQGTTINLTNNATILSYGPVHFEGTAENPISVTSSDQTGAGLIVLGAIEKSIVNYAKFDGLTAYNSPSWAVSAAVLFYESDVDIRHSVFSNNNSEDSLNIVRSKFTMDGVLFEGSRSDAFDSDFSNGTIQSTKFINLGNDAIDASGSYISLTNIEIEAAGDKGLSIGERSEMNGRDIKIQNSGVAVTAKDSSSFELTEVTLRDNDVGFALFQKKSEYSVAQGTVTDLTMVNSTENYLIQTGSVLSIDSILITGDLKDVEALMYGAVYGRATVR